MKWSILVAGDFRISSDSRIIGRELKSTIRHNDIAIVNFEGPLCGQGSPIAKDGPSLCNSSQAGILLKEAGFNVISLANNHILDFGPDGLEATLEECQANGLLTCGAGSNIKEALRPLEIEVANGVLVSIISVCEREFGIAGKQRGGAAWVSHPFTRRAIKDAKKASDIVVVVAHGGIVGVPFPPIERQIQLKRMAAAGADLVIGHHPHVPQGWEKYRDSYIFYSLGNFLFDNPKAMYDNEWNLIVQFDFEDKYLTNFDAMICERKADAVYLKTGQTTPIRAYMKRLSSIMEDRDVFELYWQELAVRLFKERYYPNLARAKYIKLLNWLRCESHYWTIKRALSVLAGNVRNRHVESVQGDLEDLMKFMKKCPAPDR